MPNTLLSDKAAFCYLEVSMC